MYAFLEKLKKRNEAPANNSPATIVFFGDSVTNGCFEVEFDGEKYLPVFDEENSYTAIFKRMMKMLYPATQLNVINSGISGDSAWGGLQRLQRDVLAYNPDMAVLCFGLNDCVLGREGIPGYAQNLKTMIKKVREIGADVIFMTPNDITDGVDYSLKTEREKADASVLATFSRAGVFAEYMQAAKEAAAECGATVVDCYAVWKKLERQGVAVNGLLSNKMNHPTREMHFIFAYELVREILGNV